MLHGTGIFAATEAPLLVLHLFVGAVAMTGLVIAAGVTERNDAGRRCARAMRAKFWNSV